LVVVAIITVVENIYFETKAFVHLEYLEYLEHLEQQTALVVFKTAF